MRTVSMFRVGVACAEPMVIGWGWLAWDGDAAGRHASHELRCGPLDDDGYDDEHDDYDLDEDDDDDYDQDEDDDDDEAYGDQDDDEDDDEDDYDEEDDEDY